MTSEANKSNETAAEPQKLLPEGNYGDKLIQKIKEKISVELLMILIIGFLFGIAIKTEVGKRINIADKTFYGKQGYNFVEIQKRLDEQIQAQSQAQKQAPGQASPSQAPPSQVPEQVQP